MPPSIVPTRYIGRPHGTRPPAYLAGPPSLPADAARVVLIVDDDPFFRSLFKVLLAQTGLPVGTILEAEESRTAMTLSREHRVDVVFCDRNLTRYFSAQGIEVLTELRKVHPDLPIYMVSGDNTEEVVEEARACGANGHILKPVNLRTLRKVLTEALAAAR